MYHCLKKLFFHLPYAGHVYTRTYTRTWTEFTLTAAGWNAVHIPFRSNDLICAGSECIDIMAEASRCHHAPHSIDPFTMHCSKVSYILTKESYGEPGCGGDDTVSFLRPGKECDIIEYTGVNTRNTVL